MPVDERVELHMQMSDYPSSLTSIFKNMCASVNNIRMTSPKVMRSVHDNT